MNKKIPVGLQLFAVRAEVEKDLAGTLGRLSQIGYRGVEPWGHDGSSMNWKGHDARTLRRMLDDNGLICCGFHLGTTALTDNLAQSIDFAQVLGNRFLIVAWDKPRMSSVEGIGELAEILNRASRTLAPLGMYCGYHSHDFDAQTVDGRIAWDLLFEKTDPEVVMQLDIGNYASGGGDPVATLRRFPNRARSLHLKEHGGPINSVIGEGAMDWPTIFDLVDTQQNTEWLVVEDCNADGSGFDVVKRSFNSLRAMKVCG